MDSNAIDPSMAVTEFCKAQAHINSMNDKTENKRRNLHERIKTYRSLLHNELEARNISCFEIQREGKDPSYIRVKDVLPTPTFDPDNILKILESSTSDSSYIESYAEKNGHDFPKMITAAVLHEIRKKSSSEKHGKTSLQVSKIKEKGYKKPDFILPNNLKSMANDLLAAKEELQTFRKELSREKEPSVQKQKLVEESVKNVLASSDPVTKTSRIHMQQGGDEWVYYLRCKEKTKVSRLGVRKVASLLEDAFAKTLSSQGFGREYNRSLILRKEFWKAFMITFMKDIEDFKQKETKVVSSLSLDKAAPKAKKKKDACDD